MKIIYGIKNLRIKEPTVATIGIFDGVHKGHRKILKLLKVRASRIQAKSCVLTFDPHPSKILHPARRPPMLISTRHKLNLLAEAGIDTAVLINFKKSFAAMRPGRFAEKVLVKRMNTKELLVGENFLFGRKRRGTVQNLKSLGKKFGFKIHAVRPLKSGGKIISSTLIRKLIMSGRLKEAGGMMGRRVSILGTVTEGAKRGMMLGFPTANLDLHHEAIPPSGVYIVKIKLAGQEYRGILNVGFRPTFEKIKRGIEPTAEVHIFNFNKPIYGKDIEVVFLRKIRDERSFRNKECLLSRIKKDMEMAKGYFRQGA